MNKPKLMVVLLMLLPGLSWAQPAPSAPEPGMLVLLGVGGVIVGALAFFRRKK
jgi:hypothetical protein